MMNKTNRKQSVEVKIRRLTKEIDAIDRFFYEVNSNEDRLLYAGMLERKRDDMVRAAVLQLHTAIEDILTSQIMCKVLNVKPEERVGKLRTKRGQALRKLLLGAGSLGFDMKLTFAASLGLITTSTQKHLMELNTLRNKCSHNWLLKVRVRRGKRPQQLKPPLLLYEGRDLHNLTVLRDFVGKYGVIYAKMFARYIS